jgi:hypothetical protein
LTRCYAGRVSPYNTAMRLDRRKLLGASAAAAFARESDALSANSGNNAMSRDASFTADFLQRHQHKLVFGSDRACADGRGTGTSQSNNPAAARMSGKCVARETLTLLLVPRGGPLRQSRPRYSSSTRFQVLSGL